MDLDLGPNIERQGLVARHGVGFLCGKTRAACWVMSTSQRGQNNYQYQLEVCLRYAIL